MRAALSWAFLLGRGGVGDSDDDDDDDEVGRGAAGEGVCDCDCDCDGSSEVAVPVRLFLEDLVFFFVFGFVGSERDDVGSWYDCAS